MRIAMVTDYYLPTLGGVQTAVKAQKESLERAGHEVTVFCPLFAPAPDPGVVADPGTSGDPDVAAGADVVALPVSPVFRPDGYPFTWPPRAAIARLTAEFRARGIEIVHTHSEMFAALAGIRAAQALNLPVVHTMHGRIDVYTRHVLPLPAITTPLLAAMHARHVDRRGIRIAADAPYTATRQARTMWRLMAAQARASDHVIVPSAHFARKLRERGITTPMTVLPNGLEPSVLDRIGEPPARTLDPGEPLRAMWVGRLSPEKRPEVFVRAAREFGPGIEAHMYGEGFARRAVERIGGPVVLHGSVPQDEVLAAMGRSHVLVSTSLDFDNQPMVFLEAIASGLPVIVADPDLAEVLPPAGAILADSPGHAGVTAAVRALREDPHRLAAASAAMIAHRAATALPATPLLEVYRSAAAARGSMTT